MDNHSVSALIREVIPVASPGFCGLAVISLAQAQALTTILVGLVTIVCTIMVTRAKLRGKE